MNATAVKAALLALASQATAILVGYGVLNNAQAGKWTALTAGIVNVTFLISHAWHTQIETKAKGSK